MYSRVMAFVRNTLFYTVPMLRKLKLTKNIYLCCLSLLPCLVCKVATTAAQTGLSVTPPRAYYELDAGQTGTEQITITNASRSTLLELAITLADWEYDGEGNNVFYPPDSLRNSCAGWVVVKDGSYLSLKPGESRTLDVSLSVPNTLDPTIPAYTAMLFVTQMNPVDDVNEQGANIKVSVRSGIKLFHRPKTARQKGITINNLLFNKDNSSIELHFENTGNVWADGTIHTELLNTATGKDRTLDDIVFYSMPGNLRKVTIPLPERLKMGTDFVATVIIDYGKRQQLEAAELTFRYE